MTDTTILPDAYFMAWAFTVILVAIGLGMAAICWTGIRAALAEYLRWWQGEGPRPEDVGTTAPGTITAHGTRYIRLDLAASLPVETIRKLDIEGEHHV